MEGVERWALPMVSRAGNVDRKRSEMNRGYVRMTLMERIRISAARSAGV